MEDAQILIVDLDENGKVLHPRLGVAVPDSAVDRVLRESLHIPDEATDIFVFVHGWQNSREKAMESCMRLRSLIAQRYSSQPERYFAAPGFSPIYILIRWPSVSSPFPWGYRKIRDRAHEMSTKGYAEFVIAQLLGYLNSTRRLPSSGAPALRTKQGQYLHCIGHSFGGRFLGEAIMAAANPSAPPSLGYPWGREKYPYTVDSLIIFQMASRPDAFESLFEPLLSDSPISGPIVLTHSRSDRALRWWHRVMEGAPGVGATGAQLPPGQSVFMSLPKAHDPCHIPTAEGRVINVDASRLFRRGWWRIEGAHSDIWYPDSANLVLSVALAARPEDRGAVPKPL